MWSAQGMFPQMLQSPLMIPTNMMNQPHIPVPAIHTVNPGQPNYINFPQPPPNPTIQYPLSNQLNQTLSMNGINPTNGINNGHNLMNGAGLANDTSAAQNLSKSISGRQRSATPAQDRLKNIQPLNPDPKPPVPSSSVQSSSLPKIVSVLLSFFLFLFFSFLFFSVLF